MNNRRQTFNPLDERLAFIESVIADILRRTIDRKSHPASVEDVLGDPRESGPDHCAAAIDMARDAEKIAATARSLMRPHVSVPRDVLSTLWRNMPSGAAKSEMMAEPCIRELCACREPYPHPEEWRSPANR